MPIAKELKRTGVSKSSEYDPKIKLDLKQLFGDFPERADSLKQAIGGAILDKIKQRTLKGQFLETSGKARTYEDSYVNSFDFKVFGKSKNKVNLKASNAMLNDLDLTDDTGTKLEFGFNETLQKEKAHGHITGAVGKKRDFFGITQTELNEIKKEFQPKVDRALNEEPRSNIQVVPRRARESNLAFLRRLFEEF